MTIERRYMELRAVDAKRRRIEGTVVRYGDVANVGGAFKERIAPRALEFDSVMLNVQHDRRVPIARTGRGMTLTHSASGLEMVTELPATRAADDTIEAIEAGLFRGLSVEMVVTKDEWSQQPGDLAMRDVAAAKLHAIAVVDNPAYPHSQLRELRMQARMHLVARPVTFY